MLTLIAMEQPHAFDPTSIRNQRVKVLQSIRPLSPKNVATCVVRGQYKGYHKERGVQPASRTETFVAMKVLLHLPRWKHVPFYLRTGKKLEKKVTEISIHYKKPAVCIGDACLFPEKDVLRNVLSIRIHPDDGVHLRLMVKKLGLGMKLTDTTMAFHYKQAFPDFSQPEAYEKLFLDTIRGDQTLFARTDGIEASWQLITNILEGWSRPKPRDQAVVGLQPTTQLYTYAPGSMGPKEADALIEKDGRHWYLHKDRL
ncbi:glucose-6-phosphate dehydrogenase, partial [Candidatus Gottesmanbacteria bacterium]|nr:glucose-6-phosphate dehydrogenase [Candidatus Gottesmanbacteria bacterium]